MSYEFSLFEDRNLSPSSFACGEVIISSMNVTYGELRPNDPFMFDCASTNCATVGSNGHLPPSTTKDEPYIFNEDFARDYYRFARALMSLLPMDGLRMILI